MPMLEPPIARMIVIALSIIGANPASADDKAQPSFSLSLRDTLDGWDNAAGGATRGGAVLNKLQVAATLQGDQVGLDGLSVHAQIFRVDGSSPSRRVGDIQTVDSIDAEPVTRLFEAWAEKKIGSDERSLAVRAGLMDLNADFDSIQTASLFLNSSHGIGADLSRSGVDGPSIYPVSAAGIRLSILPSPRWTFRFAAFDGVSGNPDQPHAFVSERLAASDGALLVGQADYHLSDKAKIEAGAWHYTSLPPALTGTMSRGAHDEGGYLSIEGPLPGARNWSAWGRLGFANGNAQIVDRYIGFGVVGTGLFKGRNDDRIGIAVAQARIGMQSREKLGLPIAETSIEASYQLKVGAHFAAQPDVQYVIHPASGPHIKNALIMGVRLVFTAGYPKPAPPTEASDPTVPPDGPQPDDAAPSS